jgi:large subunit ribosomal protein L4
MQIDIVNHNNEKVGAIDVRDDVFGGRVNGALIWQSVVRANAGDRRGTHKTKNRADVSGTGKKPWKQKGTGRARVGSSRTPLWRKGGTVFGPQPRSYAFTMPKKAELGALRGALSQKLKDGRVVVVEALTASEVKTKAAAAMLKRLGLEGRALLIDVAPDANLSQAVRNIPGVVIVASGRLTARDVETADRVLTTTVALEKLQEALAS